MNRIISEELYKRLQKSLQDVFDARLAEDLRNTPIATLQSDSGQVGEAERLYQPGMSFASSSDSGMHYKGLKAIIDELNALRQPVETAGEVERFIWEKGGSMRKHPEGNWVRHIDHINALRTQPQAPVVEVPSESELIKTFADGEANGRGPIKWVAGVRAIHALLQSKWVVG